MEKARNRTILPLIFSSSLAALACEVTLSRVFSVSLGYHFAFMIVSIAMLGIAAAGTLLAIFPRLARPDRLPLYALALGGSLSACYLAANSIPFDPAQLPWSPFHLLWLGLYYPVLALPFFFSGLVIASALALADGQANLFYGADLLGAATGSLAVLGILSLLPPEKTILFLSCLVLVVSSFVLPRRQRVIPIFLVGANIILFSFPPGLSPVRISPFKELPAALRQPGAEHLSVHHGPFARIDILESPAARFAPGLSLRYQEALPEQKGITVDGDSLQAVTRAGDRAEMEFLDWLPAALPWHLAGPGAAAVLDPGGGLPALMGRFHGRETFKVEGNPLLLKVVREELGDFSGHVYRENTETGLGRTRLQSREERFSLIDISLLEASPAGRFGISEDYRYTVEAFRAYLDHLAPGGILAVNLYLQPPPRTELRMAATLAEALEEAGLAPAAERLAAIRSWGMITILASNQPFTPEQVGRIRQFARERWFDPVYLPGAEPRETENGLRFVETAEETLVEGFRAVADPLERDRFLAEWPFDVSPARDDAPFFHYYFKISRLGETYDLMDRRWHYFIEQGLILPPVVLQAAILGSLLMLLPAAAGRKRKKPPGKMPAGGKKFLLYFACLGLGYMFVVTTLIQSMVLPLEHPPYALAAVLASTLAGAGSGSLLAHRFTALKNPKMSGIIAIAALACGFASPLFGTLTAGLPLSLKLPALFLFLLPLTFFMGIPFPAGLERLQGRTGMVGWAWAANGSFSVLAPPAATMAAMAIGFRGVLWLGASFYLLAFFASGWLPRPRPGISAPGLRRSGAQNAPPSFPWSKASPLRRSIPGSAPGEKEGSRGAG